MDHIEWTILNEPNEMVNIIWILRIDFLCNAFLLPWYCMNRGVMPLNILLISLKFIQSLIPTKSTLAILMAEPLD